MSGTYFDTLPRPLAHGLLMGAADKGHLLKCMDAALAAGLSGLGLELLTEAWLLDPLDGHTAQALADLDARGGGSLPKPLKSACKAVAALFKSSAARTIRSTVRTPEPTDVGAWRTLLTALQAQGDEARASALVRDTKWPAPLVPLMELQAAHALLTAGDVQEAEARYRACRPALGLAVDLPLAACLRAQGRLSEARGTLAALAQAQPWRVAARLALFDLDTERHTARARLPGRTAILLYCWNKADDLDATLRGLMASDLDAGADDWLVRVLDNGSDDATSEVLAAWQERCGGKLEAVTLPVNIGAPAARNWLAALPEARGAAFCCYLDDDVDLPADWLSRLGAAQAAYPEAGVWGATVHDHDNPRRVQVAEAFLDPWGEHASAVRISGLHMLSPDMGQLAHMRPCASVTGCCHLFRTERLAQSGPFDVALSPTQFDDLDHDLALLRLGHAAVHTGHLRVGHRRRSGARALTTRRGAANAEANFHKLRAKYEPDDVAALHDATYRTLAADLRAKAATLSTLLPRMALV